MRISTWYMLSGIVLGGVASTSAQVDTKQFQKREGAPIDQDLWDRVNAQRVRMLNRNAKILKNHDFNTMYASVDPLARIKSAAQSLEASSPSPIHLSRRTRPRAVDRRGSISSSRVGIGRRQSSSSGSGTNGTATMDMFNYYTGVDITYVGNLTLGTPAQSFLVLPDTGSADLWMIESGIQTEHATFDPSTSSTYRTNNAPFDEQYGSGEVSGIAANETASVGGLTVVNQGFGLVNETDSAIEQSPFDGLLGMAFSTISELGAYTFFENAILNGELANPVFSVYLSRGDDYQGGLSTGYLTNGAELGFGYVVTPPVAVTDADFAFSNVLVEGYWEIACDGITLNGNTVSGTSFYAAIDTGTSLIYLPTTITAAFYAQFGGISLGSGQYAVPAANITSLPTLGLAFGGRSFQMNFDDFALQYTDSSREYVLGAIVGSDQQDPQGNPVAIVGDAFLKNVLSVYSYSQNGQPAIGFASLSSSATNSTVVAATSSVPGLVTTRGPGGVTATGTIPIGTTAATSTPTPSSAASGAQSERFSWLSRGGVTLACFGVGVVLVL